MDKQISRDVEKNHRTWISQKTQKRKVLKEPVPLQYDKELYSIKPYIFRYKRTLLIGSYISVVHAISMRLNLYVHILISPSHNNLQTHPNDNIFPSPNTIKIL